MTNGWVKIHRQLWQKGYYKKSKYVHLWLHLLLKANHKPNEWLYKNKTMKVNRGQFITSRKTLSLETGINQSSIEHILKCFESEQQIKQQNLYTSRLITILKYNNYQISEQQNDSKITAREQQDNTNKKDKNVKNDKKRFAPPQLQEVIEYFKLNNYSLPAANKFFNYYKEGDWKDSNGKKVVGWKQKAQGIWFKPENEIPKSKLKSLN